MKRGHVDTDTHRDTPRTWRQGPEGRVHKPQGTEDRSRGPDVQRGLEQVL